MHKSRRTPGWRTGGLPIAAALLFALGPAILSAQQGTGTIRGNVTNAASKAPLGNAQVFIAGTTLGGLTTADGSFSIVAVPLGSRVVRVRLIGYQPIEKTVTVTEGGTATVDFALTQSAISLDEVVVTGTGGSARKREVGNSIAQVKVSDIPDVPSTVSSMLTGRLAGVNVTTGTGNSGGGQSIRLRGTTSVALTNQPLIFIDGVRTRSDEYPRNTPFTGSTQRGANVNGSPLNDINPDDIERIEIVKGAAAATLYGTDAAAGVIQIFTKRGAAGAARWNVQLNSGISSLQQFGTDEAPLLFMDPFLRNSKTGRFGPDNYAARYGSAVQVSGGQGESLRYLLSGSADNTDGVLPNDKDRKYQLRANLDFMPIKNIVMNFSNAYTNNLVNQTPAGNNAQGVTLNAFRRDRNYFSSENPDTIAQVFQQQLDTYIDRSISGLTTTWTPFTRFSSRFTIGYDRAALENRNLRPFGFPGVPLGYIQEQRWSNSTLSTDWVNNFEFGIGNDLRITASAGTQYVNSLVSDVIGLAENFATPSAPTVASGGLKNADENRQRVITGGAFSQALIGFKDRYFLTFGGRVDGNSAFGKDFGFQFYPKVSGSWVISEESFWKPVLGTTKLRAAYGAAGRAPGAFAAVRTYDQVGWGTATAVRPNNLGNPDLGPERTSELELGFDESLLEGRLGIDFTYFKATTTDALFNVRSIPTNGFLNNTLRNVGELEKSGVEATINLAVIERPTFGLNVGLNIATNNSKVVSLGGAPSFSLGNNGWVVEGQPAPVIQGIVIRNPDAVGAAPDTASNHNFGPANPTSIIGGSLSLRTWRNISISMRGERQSGAYILESASSNALQRSVLWPTCFDAYKHIAANQPITVRETLTCIPKNVRSDMFIFSADFFKIRDITVSVPLGRAIPGTNSSSFVFSAQNIFRKNYGMPLFDPEMSGNDGFNASVRYINEHIPSPAVFLTSLRVSF